MVAILQGGAEPTLSRINGCGRAAATIRIPKSGPELPMHCDVVHIGAMQLPGLHETVDAPLGLVLFAHGSGSNHRSPRNEAVAAAFHGHRLATLRFDLLRADEAADRCKVFDIALLAERLGEALDWVRPQPALAGLRVGLFGASTGAAAALRAAADRPAQVHAVVSRGGRPDLAEPSIAKVLAPTLLIVGANDPLVLALNRRALDQLPCERRLEIVPGAGHLFEEPGTLECVTRLAADWFKRHLAPRADGDRR